MEHPGAIRWRALLARGVHAHLASGGSRNAPQHATLTKRAALHSEGKDPLEQPGPAPARRLGAGFRLLHALLACGGDNRAT